MFNIKYVQYLLIIKPHKDTVLHFVNSLTSLKNCKSMNTFQNKKDLKVQN
jgi:hypothetical protein